MGKHFGNLQRLKGVTYYSLSPNELRPFAGLLSPGFQNFCRRYSRRIFPLGIPLIGSILLYNYVITEHEKSVRKNPDDFKDDV